MELLFRKDGVTVGGRIYRAGEIETNLEIIKLLDGDGWSDWVEVRGVSIQSLVHSQQSAVHSPQPEEVQEVKQVEVPQVEVQGMVQEEPQEVKQVVQLKGKTLINRNKKSKKGKPKRK